MREIKGYTMPEGLYYHRDHTWVRVNDDGTMTVGMTEFYGNMAGDTTYIDMPEEGDEVEQGETAGKIQSSKWVGKLGAPVSGEIVEINEDLEDDFTLINSDPYGAGWIMRIEPSDPEAELESLMSETAEIAAFLEAEIKAAGMDTES